MRKLHNTEIFQKQLLLNCSQENFEIWITNLKNFRGCNLNTIAIEDYLFDFDMPPLFQNNSSYDRRS